MQWHLPWWWCRAVRPGTHFTLSILRCTFDDVQAREMNSEIPKFRKYRRETCTSFCFPVSNLMSVSGYVSELSPYLTNLCRVTVTEDQTKRAIILTLPYCTPLAIGHHVDIFVEEPTSPPPKHNYIKLHGEGMRSSHDKVLFSTHGLTSVVPGALKCTGVCTLRIDFKLP